MADVNLRSRHTMDDSDFQRKVRKATDATRDASKKMAGHFAGAAKAFAGIFLAGVGVRALRGMADEIDRIGKLATRFDASVESIQQLDFIAGQTGGNMEMFATALTRAGRVLSDPKNLQAAEAAKALGLNVREFIKLDPVQRLAALSDAFENAEDKGRAHAEIYKLVGRNVDEMIPALRTGAEGIREMAGSIDTLSESSVRKIEFLNDRWDEFKRNLKATFVEDTISLFDGGVVDEIAEGQKRLEEMRKEMERIKELRENVLPGMVGAVIGGGQAADPGKAINDNLKLTMDLMFGVAQAQLSVVQGVDKEEQARRRNAAAMKRENDLRDKADEVVDFFNQDPAREARLEMARERFQNLQNAPDAMQSANSGLSSLGELSLIAAKSKTPRASFGIDKVKFDGLDRQEKLQEEMKKEMEKLNRNVEKALAPGT